MKKEDPDVFDVVSLRRYLLRAQIGRKIVDLIVSEARGRGRCGLIPGYRLFDAFDVGGLGLTRNQKITLLVGYCGAARSNTHFRLLRLQSMRAVKKKFYKKNPRRHR